MRKGISLFDFTMRRRVRMCMRFVFWFVNYVTISPFTICLISNCVGAMTHRMSSFTLARLSRQTLSAKMCNIF